MSKECKDKLAELLAAEPDHVLEAVRSFIERLHPVEDPLYYEGAGLELYLRAIEKILLNNLKTVSLDCSKCNKSLLETSSIWKIKDQKYCNPCGLDLANEIRKKNGLSPISDSLKSPEEDEIRDRRDIQEAHQIAILANEYGWNGVENSKILSVFIEDKLKRNVELERENEGLRGVVRTELENAITDLPHNSNCPAFQDHYNADPCDCWRRELLDKLDAILTQAGAQQTADASGCERCELVREQAKANLDAYKSNRVTTEEAIVDMKRILLCVTQPEVVQKDTIEAGDILTTTDGNTIKALSPEEMQK